MYDTILVPTDGSDGANRAVEHALDLAERYDAALHAIFVVDTARYGEPALSSTELVIDRIADEGRELLDDLGGRADNEGLGLTTRTCQGSPREEIVAYADEIDADLIVMGFQGRSHREHMGSVVDRVVRTAGRAVLVA